MGSPFVYVLIYDKEGVDMNFSLVLSTKLMGILFPETWHFEVIDNPLSPLGSHGVVDQNLEQACQREYYLLDMHLFIDDAWMSISKALPKLSFTYLHLHFTLGLYLFYLISLNKYCFEIKNYLLWVQTYVCVMGGGVVQ